MGRPVLDLFVERLTRARSLNSVVLATTTNAQDIVIEDFAGRYRLGCFRGSELDVLDRFLRCAEAHSADVIVRVTSDCPAVDPALVDQTVESFLNAPGTAIAMNNLPRSYPHGLDVEVFSRSALEVAAHEAREPHQREHVTPFLRENPDRFPHVRLTCPVSGCEKIRVTLDTAEDLRVLDLLFRELYPANPAFGWRDIVQAFRLHPDWAGINT